MFKYISKIIFDNSSEETNAMKLLSNVKTAAHLQYTLLLSPDCKYFHPLTMILYNQTGSTCWKISCSFYHVIAAWSFKPHVTEEHESRSETAVKFISSYLDSQEPPEQHVSMSFKCFIRSSLPPPLLHPLGDNDPLSLLPLASRLLYSLHLACVRWESMCVSEGVSLFVQTRKPVWQLTN